MRRGHELWLALYGETLCREWIYRGYKDNLLGYFERATLYLDWTPDIPWDTDEFCFSHRSNLIRKMPEYYGPMWPDVPDDLPYVWPVK